jgi:hypothetical protein
MEVHVEPDRPDSATLRLYRAEYTWAYLMQHFLLAYDGPLGRVTYCGIAPFDEAQCTVDLRVQVDWTTDEESDPSYRFKALCRTVLQDIRGIFGDLQRQYIEHSAVLEDKQSIAFINAASASVAPVN